MQLFSVNRMYLKSSVKRVIALAIMIIITVSSVVTVTAATSNAQIDCDGKIKTVQLFSSNTDEILKSANIQVDADDLVVRSTEKTPSGEIQITVKSAYEINVAFDNQVRTVTAHYGDTVEQTIAKAGVTLSGNDVVTPSLTEKVTEGTRIQVRRKFHISITSDGKTKEELVTEGSVENALSQTGITLGKEDTVSVDKAVAVSEGMKITVARVTYNEVTTTEEIAFSNTNENSNTLYKGEKQIETAGKNGSQTVVTRQRLLDGKVTGSEIISKTVIAQPVNQVTRVGAKDKPSAYAQVGQDGTLVDQNGKTVSYKKCFSGKCTAYTGGGTTSTGRAAAFGLVAVNPKMIPYGSRLYICSPNGKIVYGYAIAADTGGFAKKGRVIADLYYDTYSQCANFGLRNMCVYVL